MGRPDEGRTETVTQRSLRVLFNTLEEKHSWQTRAEKAQRKLSPFLLECAEAGLQQRPTTRAEDRVTQLEAQSQNLRVERDRLQEELRWKNELLRKKEHEIQELSRRPPVSGRPGQHRFMGKLLELLDQSPSVQERDLWSALDVIKDSTAALEVIRQLEILERGRAIEKTPNGWRRLRPKSVTRTF